MLSMTGYGSARAEEDSRVLSVEIKTVNHRFLDIAFRTPKTFLFLEDAMRKELSSMLERGHVDAFAALLSEHWELSKKIDAGSTNPLLDQIFDAVDDLIDGRMVCGAGGGGFLQVMLKKGVTKEILQARLKSVFQDTDINVWPCTLI